MACPPGGLAKFVVRQRGVVLAGLSAPHLQQTLDDLNTLDGELVDPQRAAAQPKAHTYELIPQETRYR